MIYRRDPADPSTKINNAWDAAYALLQHDDLLPESLATDLRKFQREQSAKLHPISQYDERIKMLDEKFPDTEHFYVLAGAGVTWCGRKRPGAERSRR